MFLALGALSGTAYAGYEMIETPGYYVHQWNLVNGDLVRPLYVRLSELLVGNLADHAPYSSFSSTDVATV